MKNFFRTFIIIIVAVVLLTSSLEARKDDLSFGQWVKVADSFSYYNSDETEIFNLAVRNVARKAKTFDECYEAAMVSRNNDVARGLAVKKMTRKVKTTDQLWSLISFDATNERVYKKGCRKLSKKAKTFNEWYQVAETASLGTRYRDFAYKKMYETGTTMRDFYWVTCKSYNENLLRLAAVKMIESMTIKDFDHLCGYWDNLPRNSRFISAVLIVEKARSLGVSIFQWERIRDNTSDSMPILHRIALNQISWLSSD